MAKFLNTEDEGKICSFIRDRKDKKLAVSIATSLFSVTIEQINEILKKWNLTDASGNWIEAMRTTGLEDNIMEKMQLSDTKTDFSDEPSKAIGYYWSKGRKEKLRELYASGTTLPRLAQHFGTDEETIIKAVDRFGLTREIISENNVHAGIGTGIIGADLTVTTDGISIEDFTKLARKGILPVESKVPVVVLREDLRSNIEKASGIVKELQEHNDRTIDYLDNDNNSTRWCFYELGQVEAKLANTLELMEQALDILEGC